MECWELNAKRTQTRKEALSVSTKSTSEFSTFFSFYTKKSGFQNAIVWQRIQEVNISEIWNVFRGKVTWLLFNCDSSPTGWACNLRRTANLGSEVEQRAGKYLEFLLQSCLFTVMFQSDLLLLEKGFQLSFQVLACQGTITDVGLNFSAWSHPFHSTVGIMIEGND